MTPILVAKIIDNDTGKELMPEQELLMSGKFPHFENGYMVMTWSKTVNYCKTYEEIQVEREEKKGDI